MADEPGAPIIQNEPDPTTMDEVVVTPDDAEPNDTAPSPDDAGVDLRNAGTPRGPSHGDVLREQNFAESAPLDISDDEQVIDFIQEMIKQETGIVIPDNHELITALRNHDVEETAQALEHMFQHSDSQEKILLMAGKLANGASGAYTSIAGIGGADSTVGEMKGGDKRRLVYDTMMNAILSFDADINNFANSIFDDLLDDHGNDLAALAKMSKQELLEWLKQNKAEEFQVLVDQLKAKYPGLNSVEAEDLAAQQLLNDIKQRAQALIADQKASFEGTLSTLAEGTAHKLKIENASEEELTELMLQGDSEAFVKLVNEGIENHVALQDMQEELLQFIEASSGNPEIVQELEQQLAEIEAALAQQETVIGLHNELAHFFDINDIDNMSLTEMIEAAFRPKHQDMLKYFEELYGNQWENAFLAAAEEQGLTKEQVAQYGAIMKEVKAAAEELASTRQSFEEGGVMRVDIAADNPHGLTEGSYYVFDDGQGGHKLMGTSWTDDETTQTITDSVVTAWITENAEGTRMGTATEAENYLTTANRLTASQLSKVAAKIEIHETEVDTVMQDAEALKDGRVTYTNGNVDFIVYEDEAGGFYYIGSYGNELPIDDPDAVEGFQQQLAEGKIFGDAEMAAAEKAHNKSIHDNIGATLDSYAEEDDLQEQSERIGAGNTETVLDDPALRWSNLQAILDDPEKRANIYALFENGEVMSEAEFLQELEAMGITIPAGQETRFVDMVIDQRPQQDGMRINPIAPRNDTAVIDYPRGPSFAHGQDPVTPSENSEYQVAFADVAEPPAPEPESPLPGRNPAPEANTGMSA